MKWEVRRPYVDMLAPVPRESHIRDGKHCKALVDRGNRHREAHQGCSRAATRRRNVSQEGPTAPEPNFETEYHDGTPNEKSMMTAMPQE